MDLQEFVKETLVQICRGVEDAGLELHRDGDGPAINPRSKENESPLPYRTVFIAFDVAVVASEKTGTEGKAGIQVFGFVDVNTGGRSGKESATTSRVSFGIPVVLPPAKVGKDGRHPGALS